MGSCFIYISAVFGAMYFSGSEQNVLINWEFYHGKPDHIGTLINQAVQAVQAAQAESTVLWLYH